jgi:pimeloyl-ACP methyl ester carboxylesterase
MAFLHTGDVSLRYEEYGAGYPLLLFAPGGMKSSIEFWDKAPFNPIRELAGDFHVIAIDQRNAGSSRAPIHATDGWQSYANDHLALLDHLKIERCHLMGGCIGSAYCLSLIAGTPERVSAAVLQNPVGLASGNRSLFFKMFDDWAVGLDPSLGGDAASLQQFRSNMFGSDFVFSTSRDSVRKMTLPLLILAGSDPYHPAETSQEIKALAPNAEFVPEWKPPEIVRETVMRVKAFLLKNTPGT